MNIDKELLSAWAGLTPPPRSQITEHDCLECAEIREFFGGKSWTDFADVDALRYHHEALHLFAPSAYQYYLPAFIRASLLDSEIVGLIRSTIVSTIGQELGSASRGRLELLSSPQRAVLARFLRAPTFNLAEGEDVATMAELLAGSGSV